MAINPISSVAAQVLPVPRTQVREKQESKVVEKVDGQENKETDSRVDAPKKIVSNSQENGKQESEQNDLQKQQLSNEKIKKSLDRMNKNMINSEALFGIHEPTNRVTIKIVDKETKELIKELPPEKTLDLIAKAWEMAGLLVDEKR